MKRKETFTDMELNSSLMECSKPKRSKSCDTVIIYNDDWAHMPSLILYQIFDFLNEADRISASSVCKYWRENSFNSKWWKKVHFQIEPNNLDKAYFYTNTFGNIVSEATVSLNTLSPQCVDEFIVLLKLFNENHHLKSLCLQPSHCRFDLPVKYINDYQENHIEEIVNLFMSLLSKLERLSIGCVEDLTKYLNHILTLLTPTKVNLLALASVKDEPEIYEEINFDSELIVPFNNLQILSIDYDNLTDKFLYHLTDATKLKRLVVHLHSISITHPGTTNAAWRDFKRHHPECELRLSVIHAFRDINTLHETLVREMPLSHLKVFFCENINMELLHNLSAYYPNTLRSLMWIDSLNHSECSYSISKCSAIGPDPILCLAWLCHKFDELVLFGYKYNEENLIALGRLKGRHWNRLDICEKDILFNARPLPPNDNVLVDLPKNMQRHWKPLKYSHLHPILRDPANGDSDEFLLPIVLADLS